MPEAESAPTVDEPKTFDADYVEKLRKENAKYRTERNEANTKLTELQKKAEDWDAAEKKRQEEQGNYKTLYEDATKKLETLSEYEARIKTLEGSFNEQLESLKKGMSEKQIALLEKLPPMTPEARLDWARELLGAKPATHNEPRPGGGDTASVEVVLKEYASTRDVPKRMAILSAAKAQNPHLYKLLTEKNL